MATASNQRRKNWQKMPGIVHERDNEYLLSKSMNSYPNCTPQNNLLSFIVDWQLNDIQRNPQQLSLFFKE